ncbi:MAG TPA: dTMP kinase [Candidatus Krumholzibacteria bacterium]|nr:dTMP kinase [Candidatus Krumholzibacteria bacterium]
MAGALVAFEGIDQAGKQTQARAVQQHLQSLGLACELRWYPDYETPIGALIRSALVDATPLAPRARTMLFAANRWERDGAVRELLGTHAVVLVDRYSWSNVVYGLAQGYDETWLRGLEAGLAEADLTVFVDIAPEESRRRKARDRDGFERDQALLESARAHYLRFAQQPGWMVVDGMQPPPMVTAAILRGLGARLGARFPPLAALRG